MDGANEMLKRLRAFCQVDMATVKPFAEGGSRIPREKIVAEESMMITRVMPKNAYIVALDEKGKEFSSTEFSEFLGERKDHGETVVFVIGGAFGLSPNFKSSAKVMMSMSKMTFTHQMIRLFLLEQIYRGFCILTGKEYHY